MPRGKLKLVESMSGPAHCGVCGERFMGEDRAEVVLKKKRRVGSVIIHANCFNPKTMEIA